MTPAFAAWEAYQLTSSGVPGADEHQAWEAAAQAAIERKPDSERVAELVTEVNELRALLGEILDKLERSRWYGGRAWIADIPQWHERAGITPAVVTAGTEHLAEKIRGLAIPDEES